MTNTQIWARFGCSFTMTEVEREQLLAATEIQQDKMFHDMIKIRLKNGGLALDGEVYSPGDYCSDANPLGRELATDLDKTPIFTRPTHFLCIKAENHMGSSIIGMFNDDAQLFSNVKQFLMPTAVALSTSDIEEFKTLKTIEELMEWCDCNYSELLAISETAYALEWVTPASSDDLTKTMN